MAILFINGKNEIGLANGDGKPQILGNSDEAIAFLTEGAKTRTVETGFEYVPSSDVISIRRGLQRAKAARVDQNTGKEYPRILGFGVGIKVGNLYISLQDAPRFLLGDHSVFVGTSPVILRRDQHVPARQQLLTVDQMSDARVEKLTGDMHRINAFMSRQAEEEGTEPRLIQSIDEMIEYKVGISRPLGGENEIRYEWVHNVSGEKVSASAAIKSHGGDLTGQERQAKVAKAMKRKGFKTVSWSQSVVDKPVYSPEMIKANAAIFSCVRELVDGEEAVTIVSYMTLGAIALALTGKNARTATVHSRTTTQTVQPKNGRWLRQPVLATAPAAAVAAAVVAEEPVAEEPVSEADVEDLPF